MIEVDPSVTCGSQLILNVQIIHDGGEQLSECVLLVPETCNPCTLNPILRVVECFGPGSSDSCPLGGAGDNNGNMDPGETISLFPLIRNTGATATNLQATASTVAPGVNITQALAIYGTIAMGSEASPIAPIELELDPAIPCGTEIFLELSITYDGGSDSLACRLLLPDVCTPCTTGPVIQLIACGAKTAVDICDLGGPGDGDGIVDPGERVQFTPTFRNIGEAGTNVQVTAATGNPLITMLTPTVVVGNVGAGEEFTLASPLEFQLDPSFPCLQQVTFIVTVSWDGGQNEAECTFGTVEACNVCSDQPVYVVGSCFGPGSSDSCEFGGLGDMNALVDPGESLQLFPQILNNGAPATNVSVTVTGSPGLIVTVNTATYPDIGNRQVQSPNTPFEVTVEPGVECGAELMLEMTVTSDQGTSITSCFIGVSGDCIPARTRRTFGSRRASAMAPWTPAPSAARVT